MPDIDAWVLTDGKIGCQRQARGLAKALNLSYLEKRARRYKPYYWLPARYYHSSLQQLHQNSDNLEPPWPAYVISCGYRTVPISLAIRKASRGHTCCIHVQDPRVPLHLFDWVVAGAHDQLRGNNVITHHGALHDIDCNDLASMQHTQAKLIAQDEKTLSIVVGGNTARQYLSKRHAQQMATQLAQVVTAWQGPCTILSSRRTPAILHSQLQQLCQQHPHCTMLLPESPRAYLTALASAHTIMVTEESSSMISEACYTGKPVYILPLPGYRKRNKIRLLINHLQQHGYCRWWQGDFTSWSYTPLCAREQAAALLLARMHQTTTSR